VYDANATLDHLIRSQPSALNALRYLREGLMGQLSEFLIIAVVLIILIVFIWAGIFKQSISETITEIKEIFMVIGGWKK